MSQKNETMPETEKLEAPRFTMAGCAQGVRLILPIIPAVTVFGIAFGAAAAAKGLTLGEAMAMSAFVYAGVSQMVALEFWRPEWNISSLIGLALVTAAINGRMILQGASLQSWLKPFPRLTNALHLAFLTDANWLITERYKARGGHDLGILVGAGLILWVAWLAATFPGYLAGSLVSEPKRFGLDLLMPIFFSAMAVPLWKGRASLLPWCVAGAVALLTAHLVSGYSFIVVGALAGALAGAFSGEATPAEAETAEAETAKVAPERRGDDS